MGLKDIEEVVYMFGEKEEERENGKKSNNIIHTSEKLKYKFKELKLYLKSLIQSLGDQMSLQVHSPPPGNNVTVYSKGIAVQIVATCIHEKWRVCMHIVEAKTDRSHG